MIVVAERRFVVESLTAIRTAATYTALHKTFAERITALVLDHGNLREARALATAYRDRKQQLLDASMEDNQ